MGSSPDSFLQTLKSGSRRCSRPSSIAAVTITVSPLEWRTLPFGGLPTLVAVRSVQTPDGTLAQGFVVDRATLTGVVRDASDAVLPGSNTRITPAYAPQLPKLKSPNTMPALVTEAGAHHYRLQFLEFLFLIQVNTRIYPCT